MEYFAATKIIVPNQVYLQSVHLTRLLSRLMTVKSLQSEWLNTELFSAECGSTLKPCRVATANLVLYPTIIPVSSPLIVIVGTLPLGLLLRSVTFQLARIEVGESILATDWVEVTKLYKFCWCKRLVNCTLGILW